MVNGASMLTSPQPLSKGEGLKTETLEIWNELKFTQIKKVNYNIAASQKKMPTVVVRTTVTVIRIHS